MSFVNSVRTALARLRYPTVDANGNLLANITPRYDTLVNLLAVTNAGDGEIAVATDYDCTVVYRGNPSVGVAYYRSGIDETAIINFNLSSIPSATLTVIPITLVKESKAGLVDVANNGVLFGANLFPLNTGDYLLIEAQLNVLITGLDVGANVFVNAFTWDGVTNTPFRFDQNVGYALNLSGVADSIGNVKLIGTLRTIHQGPINPVNVNFKVKQDGTGTLGVISTAPFVTVKISKHRTM